MTDMKRLKTRLTKQVKMVTSLLQAGSTELVEKEMNNMEKTYAEYAEAYAQSCGLTGDDTGEDPAVLQQHQEISSMMEDVDTTYMDCKTKVCEHLMEDEKSRRSDARSSQGSNRSSKSKSSKSSSRSGNSSGSAHSKHSSKSVRQKAKVAGLKAEVEALKKTKEAELAVEMSRLEQKIKKAEAIEKVYAEYEGEDATEGEKEKERVRDQAHADLKAYIKEYRASASLPPPGLLDKRQEAIPTYPTENKEGDSTALLQHAMIDLMKIQAAPKPDLDEFSGDPLEYLYFKANFREVVEAAVPDQVGRLTRLIKYTTGEPKELIKHLVHADPGNCYDTAVTLLDKEYGNPHLISVNYLKKLRNWVVLKENDTVAYKTLYRFLLRCHVYKKDTRLLELDSTEMIRVIVAKLPPSHQSRWGRKAVDIRNTHSREADFDDLVKFVTKEQEILSDPAYSRSALADVPLVKSNATRCVGFQGECPLCRCNHDVEDCEDFLAQDVDQRHKTVFQRNLCFGCLKAIDGSHTAKTCTEQRKCRVCNGTHPTTLHGGKGTVVHHNHTTLQNNVISMCVVPVQLWHKDQPEHKVNVYCLLDDCSQGTFIRDDILDDLNIVGRETSLTVSMLNAKQKEPTFEIHKGELVEKRH